jgi:hypothetical protein
VINSTIRCSTPHWALFTSCLAIAACGSSEAERATVDAATSSMSDGPTQTQDPEGPRILTFNTNIAKVDDGPYSSVIFSLVVTDPDGVDDVIGGTLFDPVTNRPYGVLMTSASEGSYSMTLSWDAINTVRSIDVLGVADREFEVEIFDVVGHRTTGELTLQLACHAPDDLACNGECTGSDWNGHTSNERCLGCAPCPSSNDACTPQGCRQPVEAGLRLFRHHEGSTDSNVLQIFHNGEWRGVCASGFELADAKVACRQLGARGTRDPSYGNGYGPSASYWLAAVHCTGNESSLTACPFDGWTPTSTYCSAPYRSTFVNLSCDF